MKKSGIHLTALASCLLAFISAGCVGGPSFDGEAWYIRIHDRFGRPIAGAELRCDGMEAPMYSDARGRVVITQSAPLDSSKGFIRVSHPDYLDLLCPDPNEDKSPVRMISLEMITPDEALRLAYQRACDGDFSGALSILQRLTADEIGDDDGLFLSGLVYFQVGDLQQAEAYLEDISRKDQWTERLYEMIDIRREVDR
jgi:hypothetical protein